MEDNTFRLFVDEVKEKVDIAAIVEGTGGEYGLVKRGRYFHGTHHDSLVVDTETGIYHWNSRGERGDVFEWLVKRKGGDFWAHVLDVARMVGVEVPRDASGPPSATALAFRERAELFEVACAWMEGRLWKSPTALGYARGRGWSDETIRLARLGFSDPSGRGDLVGELRLNGYELDAPATVALVGLGFDKPVDVAGWARAHDIEPHANWLEKGRVFGLVDFPRLIYPHIEGRRVTYFSARNLKAEGDKLVGEVGKHKTYNLPKVLAGERRVYLNHQYTKGSKSVVLVEGPADALSLGQWGEAGVATMGLSFDDLGILETLVERHERLYVGLDGDEAGLKAVMGREKDWPLAFRVGPLARVVKWQRGKDANEWLQGMVADGIDPEAQREALGARLGQARTFAEIVANWAGAENGADRDDAMDLAFALIVKIPKERRAQYRKALADGLQMTVREYDNILKQSESQAKDRDAPVIETLGGMILDEEAGADDKYPYWVLDYMYDKGAKKAALAVRDPKGKVYESQEGVLINGNRYVAEYTEGNSFVEKGAVILPSKLGRLRTTAELVSIIEGFISHYYLLDEPLWGRIVAYYVLLTWMFDSFNALPYLRAQGDKGAGKSEFIHRIGAVCYRYMPTTGSSSESSLFRTIEKWGGTIGIDEGDLPNKGFEDHPIVKIYNTGAMRTTYIWRTEEYVNREGQRSFRAGAFSPFGPKLIAMRKEFGDDAVASRCITFKLMGKETIELKARGIPLEMNAKFLAEAESIRNMMLRWRMEHWVPEREIDERFLDVEVSARINQVTAPLKSLAENDQELQDEITRFMRAFYQETVLERSMSIAARVVEAMWEIYYRGDLRGQYLAKTDDGQEYILIGHVAKVANKIIEDMNKTSEADEEEGGDGKKFKKDGKELTSRGVGAMIRLTLQLPVGKRRGDGFPVFWDDLKMRILVRKYGIAEVDLEEELVIPEPVKPGKNGHGGQNALLA